MEINGQGRSRKVAVARSGVCPVGWQHARPCCENGGGIRKPRSQRVWYYTRTHPFQMYIFAKRYSVQCRRDMSHLVRFISVNPQNALGVRLAGSFSALCQ